MRQFHMEALYCTRNGNPGCWSGTITAPDFGVAFEQARQLVERRHRGATKLDLHAVARQTRLSPDSVEAANVDLMVDVRPWLSAQSLPGTS
jgi:dUTPase